MDFRVRDWQQRSLDTCQLRTKDVDYSGMLCYLFYNISHKIIAILNLCHSCEKHLNIFWPTLPFLT